MKFPDVVGLFHRSSQHPRFNEQGVSAIWRENDNHIATRQKARRTQKGPFRSPVWPTQPYPTFDPSRVALWRVFANCILLPRDSIPRDSQSRGSLLATKERNENQAQETQTQRPRWNLHLERRQHPRLLPRPGYTRKLSYDEEGRLTKIDRDNGTTITPVFEYGYGFDGNRRWRKDLAGNTWDWYPCGVACCAGELVTMRSTNGGASFTVLRTVTAANGFYATNQGFALPRLKGQDSIMLNDSGQIDRMQNDSMGPRKFEALNTDLRKNLVGDKDELSLALVLAAPVQALCSDILKGIPKDVIDAWNKCLKKNKGNPSKCKDSLKNTHLNAFVKYWACMESAGLYSGTQPNIDPCSMKDEDTTFCGACCFQKQLQTAWHCRLKGGAASWSLCMEKGRHEFEECGLGCGFVQ